MRIKAVSVLSENVTKAKITRSHFRSIDCRKRGPRARSVCASRTGHLEHGNSRNEARGRSIYQNNGKK